jgi:hypothetical protein
MRYFDSVSAHLPAFWKSIKKLFLEELIMGKSTGDIQDFAYQNMADMKGWWNICGPLLGKKQHEPTQTIIFSKPHKSTKNTCQSSLLSKSKSFE